MSPESRNSHRHENVKKLTPRNVTTLPLDGNNISRKGFWRLKLTRRKDRFAAKLKGLRDFLWKNLNIPDKRLVLTIVIRVIKDWINYPGISDNQRRVGQFIYQSKRVLYRWFNREGGREPGAVVLHVVLRSNCLERNFYGVI